MNLANLYFQMNQRERARDICREAVAVFRQFDSFDNLSIAYLVLGNVMSGMGDWAGAIVVWREGASVDEARGDLRSQAEKLLCIAQATVMQRYRGPGQAIPQPAYDEAMSLYERARELVSGFTDPQAVALVANSFQTQGQTASACGRIADAIQYLEQARVTYAGLGWRMQTAITDSLLGLVCMEAGRLLSPAYYADAETHHRRALEYFEQAGMRDQCWLAKYYLADTAYRRGFYAADAGTRNEHWQSAAGFIEQAAADIELIRGGYVESDAENNLATRISLVSNKEKVYVFAIQLN